MFFRFFILLFLIASPALGHGWGSSNAEFSGIQAIGDASNANVQDHIRIQGGSGIETGGTISDAGSQTWSVTVVTGKIRTTNTHVATLLAFDVAASTGNAIADDTTLWVYVDYNSGVPIITSTETRGSIDRHTELELGSVSRMGTVLHVTNNSDLAANGIGHTNERFRHQVGDQRAPPGLILGETGTRNVTVTAGEIYSKLNEHDVAAINTSGADRFNRYYRDGGTGWTLETNAEGGDCDASGDCDAWENTKYDNDSGNLATITGTRYAAQYFYAELDGEIFCLYGQAQHVTLAFALAESPPATLPKRADGGAVLLGRIVFQKSDSSAQVIETAFTDGFTGTVITEHDSLNKLAWSIAGHTIDDTVDMLGNLLDNALLGNFDELGTRYTFDGVDSVSLDYGHFVASVPVVDTQFVDFIDFPDAPNWAGVTGVFDHAGTAPTYDWDAAIKWASGAPPTMTSGEVDVIACFSPDAGVNIYCFPVVDME
jgi:hypothetical protein